ncbi:MAG: SDR family oxidoreductase [Aggregatilineales bacterium]
MSEIAGKRVAVVGTLGDFEVTIGGRLQEAGAHVLFACFDAALASAERPLQRHDLTAPLYHLSSADPLALAEQVGSLGVLDAALLCPGWYTPAEFMATTPADWDRALEVNFSGLIFAGQAIARGMVGRGSGGRLVFLSSFAALMPFLQSSVTGATLTALGAVARMAAVDLAEYGITVNVLATGWTERERRLASLTPEGQAFIEHGIPLGRLGTADDIADTCAFLLSAQARYITGAIIPVDGGYTLTRAEGKSPYPAYAM